MAASPQTAQATHADGAAPDAGSLAAPRRDDEYGAPWAVQLNRDELARANRHPSTNIGE